MPGQSKFFKSLSIILALAALARPYPAAASVTETVASSNYLVAPQPNETLSAAIFRTTPIRTDGKTFAGHTQTAIHWHADWTRQADGLCWVSNVAVEINITTSLPQLVSATPEQKTEFEIYLARLKIHENGHADIGRETARLIEKAIAASHAPCNAISVFIDNVAQGPLRDMETKNKNYDAETQHGKTQGAILDDVNGD